MPLFMCTYIYIYIYNMGPQSAVDREFLYISSGGRAAGGPPKPPPRRPKRLPRDPKDVPRGAQDPQRSSQDTPKTLPKLPRLAKSFPELPRAQIDQNGLLKPCVLRCPTSTFERPYDTFFFKSSSLWRFEHFAKIKTQKRLSLFDIGPSQTLCFTMSGLNF